MAIKITSKLTSTQRARLARQIQRTYDLRISDEWSITRVGRNLYGTFNDDQHDAARKMMVIAGTTFDYEVT